ncbi:MAG: hypothetical protein OSA95_13460 [Opitutales bacterium]|nr:hypothetical protein [Opitutales bacterium]
MNYIIKQRNWAATTIVAVLLLGGAVYLVSDPARAIIDRKVENWTEWTPETIRKYPTEWLMSAQGDLSEKQQSLKNSRFDIRRNQIRWDGSLRSSQREVAMLNKYLGKAKELYATAEMNDSWPVSLGERVYSKSYDQAKLQGAIVSQYKSKERAERRVATYKKMVSRAESLTDKIDTKQEQINEVLLDLSLTIELAKAAEQMTDLTGLSDRGKEIHVTVKALMEELDRAFDDSSIPSMNRSLNNEVIFDEIMNRSSAEGLLNSAVHVTAKEAK